MLPWPTRDADAQQNGREHQQPSVGLGRVRMHRLSELSPPDTPEGEAHSESAGDDVDVGGPEHLAILMGSVQPGGFVDLLMQGHHEFGRDAGGHHDLFDFLFGCPSQLLL